MHETGCTDQDQDQEREQEQEQEQDQEWGRSTNKLRIGSRKDAWDRNQKGL